MIVYFSGTGNTKRLAETIAQQLQDELFPITALEQIPHTATQVATLGIFFPVYAWGVPPIVEAQLTQLMQRWHEVPAYVYVVCSCGDSIGYTDRQLTRIMARQQWHYDAFASVIMPETYIALPGFKLDTPALAQKKLAASQQTAFALAERIQGRRQFHDVIRGYLPHLTSYVIRPFFNRFLVNDRYFKVNDKCIHCGKCVEHCPVNNLSLSEASTPQWKGHCTGCLACYHHCPVQAIQYLYTRGKGRYTFGE